MFRLHFVHLSKCLPPPFFSTSRFLPRRPRNLRSIFLRPIKHSTPLLNRLTMFLPIMMALLRGTPNKVNRPLRATLRTPRPLLTLPKESKQVLQDRNARRNNMLLFRLSITRVICTAIANADMGTDCNHYFLRLLPVLPNLFRGVISGIATDLFIDGGTRDVVVRANVVPPVGLFGVIYFRALVFSKACLLSIVRSPGAGIHRGRGRRVQTTGMVSSKGGYGRFVPGHYSNGVDRSLEGRSLGWAGYRYGGVYRGRMSLRWLGGAGEPL